jgi:hypothetical protein
MTHTGKNLFAPRVTVISAPRTALEAVDAGADVKAMVTAARSAGGFLAELKMRKATSGEISRLLIEGMKVHFAARYEDMVFRTTLALDNAKKRAMAESLQETSMVEQQIAREANATIVELQAQLSDLCEAAALEEVRRIGRLQQALDAGRVTTARFDKEVEAITRRADEIMERAETIARRVIENIGERLDACLSVGPQTSA